MGLSACRADAPDDRQGEPTVCESLVDCLARIPTVTDGQKYGISEGQLALAEQFRRFGEPALVRLLERLDSQDENERKIVGYAIAEFEVIDEKHLPRILDGIDNSVPWLNRALARIPSEAAARNAVELYLESRHSPGNQLFVAIERQGARAIPFVVEASLCETGCDDRRLFLLRAVLEQMDEQSRLLAAALIVEGLYRPGVSVQQQADLLSLFDVIGTPGLSAEDDLVEFRASHPALSGQVDRALVGIKSSRSGRIFRALLRLRPDTDMLWELSKTGPPAVEAGPEVVELLSHPDFEMRLRATLALGFIEYKDSVPVLVPLLNDPRDVRVNWAATRSLGRIGDEAAVDALQDVERTHWYPAVRSAAANALDRIGTAGEDGARSNTGHLMKDFWAYKRFEIDGCRRVALKAAPVNKAQKIDRDEAESVRRKLAYDTYVLGYTASDVEEQRERDPGGIITLHRGNMIEQRKDIVQVPDVALQVESGWLAGSSRGDFGGELMHVSQQGRATLVLNHNVEGIHRLGGAIVAITGILSPNEGMIFRLEIGPDGAWKAEPWIALPGAPMSSRIVETGELLVDTFLGGTILLSENGKMRMAPCVHT